MNILKNSMHYSKVLLLLLVVIPMTAFSDSTFQSSDAYSFHNGMPMKGAGTLARRDYEGVWTTASVSNLDKKSAYTVWWVIFNHPHYCVDGCGEDDLFVGDVPNPDVKPAALLATGFVTGTDGTASFSAHLAPGPTPSGLEVLFAPPGGALLDTHEAEVHLIIRSHGETIAGMADMQTTTYMGACDVNDCEDQQALVFESLIH